MPIVPPILTALLNGGGLRSLSSAPSTMASPSSRQIGRVVQRVRPIAVRTEGAAHKTQFDESPERDRERQDIEKHHRRIESVERRKRFRDRRAKIKQQQPPCALVAVVQSRDAASATRRQR